MSDGIDLTAEQRGRIRATFDSLGQKSHYELLDVARSADKKAIKRAYYQLTGEFHSDRYFGKSLGPYRAMLDAIFSRITFAHDTLTNAEARARYDAALAPEAEESRPSHVEVKKPAARAERLDSGVQPAVRTPSTPPVDEAARRQALAQRLLGGARRLTPAPFPSPTGTTKK